MRGRRPDGLTIRAPDFPELERIANSDTLPCSEFVVSALFWESPQAGAAKSLLLNSTATNARFGEPVAIPTLGPCGLAC
jgi:hypothetical protein